MEVIKIERERIEDKAVLAFIINNVISIDADCLLVHNDVLGTVKNQLSNNKITYEIKPSVQDGFSTIVLTNCYSKPEYNCEDMTQYIVIYKEVDKHIITVTHMSKEYKKALAQQRSVSKAFRNSLIG